MDTENALLSFNGHCFSFPKYQQLVLFCFPERNNNKRKKNCSFIWSCLHGNFLCNQTPAQVLIGERKSRSSRSPFEDKEIKSLQSEIYESSLGMSEETPKTGTHNTLPSTPISCIKLLINHRKKKKFSHLLYRNLFMSQINNRKR